MYSNHQMAVSLLGICVGAKVLSVLFYGLGILASRRSHIIDEIVPKKVKVDPAPDPPTVVSANFEHSPVSLTVVSS